MDKIAKHSSSILFFVINILLTVIGFLLIKDWENNKKLASFQSDFPVNPVAKTSENSIPNQDLNLPLITNSIPAASQTPLSVPVQKPVPRPATSTRTS